jgi:hypothetical protein
MGTRSRIGILEEDGSIRSIYCQFDGYIAEVGKTLYENYTTEKTVSKLIELGYLRSLKPTISETFEQSYWSVSQDEFHLDYSDNIEEFKDLFEEYNYLFAKNKWYLINPTSLEFVALETLINV